MRGGVTGVKERVTVAKWAEKGRGGEVLLAHERDADEFCSGGFFGQYRWECGEGATCSGGCCAAGGGGPVDLAHGVLAGRGICGGRCNSAGAAGRFRGVGVVGVGGGLCSRRVDRIPWRDGAEGGAASGTNCGCGGGSTSAAMERSGRSRLRTSRFSGTFRKGGAGGWTGVVCRRWG